jgi:23S rRNA (pseudouridine1915-N3)-methyltransferase
VSFSITIHAISRKGGALDEEISRYQQLIRPWANVSICYLKSPGTASYSKSGLVEAEGKIIASALPGKSYCVAMSEEGRIPAGSIGFARWLAAHEQRARALSFVIGGAYGLSPQVKKSCAELMGLSPLTLPHKLALTVLLEQIYRAFTILKGHPYHK